MIFDLGKKIRLGRMIVPDFLFSSFNVDNYNSKIMSCEIPIKESCHFQTK